jgi:hypothetical protein
LVLKRKLNNEIGAVDVIVRNDEVVDIGGRGQ